MKSIIYFTLIFSGILISSCGNGNLKDISDNPEFEHLSNNIFFTNQPLYYYKYTKNKGVIADHFLSLHQNDSNGTKVEDIPKGSHLKVSKVFEQTLKDGGTLIWITGEVFPSPTQGLTYEAVLIKDAPFFEERR